MKHCTTCHGKFDDSVSFCPTCGEVLEDDPTSIVGTVLDGQYQIDSMLGKGGMGAVYRARHILLGDKVAIKVLPPEVRNNAEWLRRFRREGQAARRFRHPNSVTVYDLRTASDGVIYMVMEYVEGHTLDSEIRQRGRLTHGEAFQLLEPIMSVLNTAHEMGVVHRDLKPENIMIGKAGTNGEPVIKLLDLGIAKMREIAESDGGDATKLTVAGQVLGTPYYMSPEQWGEIPRDGSSEIDGRADIYSLGLVFYEMIAGRRPYSGKTLQELRREHLQVTPPPLNQVMPDVPQGFSDTIAKSIAKDRGDRQASAGELATQLRANLGPAQTFSSGVSQAPDGSDLARTIDLTSARNTSSDVPAPTILTIESQHGMSQPAPAPVPVVEQPLPKPAGFVSQADQSLASSATAVVQSPDLGSSVTIPSPPKPAPPASKRGGGAIFIVAGVLLVVLLVVGAGGFAIFKWFSGKTTDGSTTSTAPSKVTAPNTNTEFGRYWLEVEPKPDTESVRVSGVDPLTSGKSFKFHLVFEGDGYAYIIGPGEKNLPVAFLTAKPPKETGLDSNQVSKGADFSFPSGSGNWLTLDKSAGTENYTVVFSPRSDLVPSFLNGEYTGKGLDQTEQGQLNDFLAKYKSNRAVTELNAANPDAPFVALKVPAKADAAPIIFEIRIQHR
jgi:eukaryotic-like serine/threonine-protein kinase